MPTLAKDLPFAMYSNMVGYSSSNKIDLSNATYFNSTSTPGSLMTDGAIAAGIWTPITVNSPYSGASFYYGPGQTMQVSGRLVSVGLSYEASTNVNNLGGVTYMMPSPAHDDVAQFPLSVLGQLDECVKRRLTNKKQWTVIAAVDDSETGYVGAPIAEPGLFNASYVDAYPFSNNYAGPANQPLGNVGATAFTASTATFGFAAAIAANSIGWMQVGTAGTFNARPPLGISGTVGGTAVYIIGDATNSMAANTLGTTIAVSTTAYLVYVPAGVAITAAAAVATWSTNQKYTIPVGNPVTMMRYVPSGTSANLECEVIAHAEFVGTLTAALHSPSHADIVGMQSVIAANARVPQLQTAFPNSSIDALHAIALRDAIGSNSFLGGAVRGLGRSLGAMGITPESVGQFAGYAAYGALRGSMGAPNAASVRALLH